VITDLLRNFAWEMEREGAKRWLKAQIGVWLDQLSIGKVTTRDINAVVRSKKSVWKDILPPETRSDILSGVEPYLNEVRPFLEDPEGTASLILEVLAEVRPSLRVPKSYLIAEIEAFTQDLQ
jgi:hypothetical protein